MSLALLDRTGFEVDAIDVFCVDAETEILTQRGWLRHEQLRVGDLALAINPSTQAGEWSPVSHVRRFAPEPRTVLRVEGRALSILATADHRWFVRRRYGQPRGVDTRRRWEFRVSADLDAECTVPTAAPVANLPQESKWSDALVEVVAWFWTEGHIRKPPQAGVTITQSLEVNERHVVSIRVALTGLFGPPHDGLPGIADPAWTEYHHGPNAVFALNRAAGEVVTEHAPGRVPTPAFLTSLTQAQLDLFIERSIDGDGTRSGVVTLAQKSEAAASMFQMACLLAGRSANLRFRAIRPTVDYKMATVAVNKRSSAKPLRQGRVEWTDYDGMVWCPTTGTGTWLARRNGMTYFTGNCGYGGSSQGIHAAGAVVRAAANHSELSIECHAKNFPDTDHWHADLSDHNSPRVVDRNGKSVPGRYIDPAQLPRARFAWFSPSCFPASTLILAKRGLIPIEDIVVGDEVWTHLQRWRPVTATMRREAQTVVVGGLGNRHLEVTPNHGVWARRDGDALRRRPARTEPGPCDNCGAPAPLLPGSKTKYAWYCDRRCNTEASNRRSHFRIGDPERIEAAQLSGAWWATPREISDVPLPRFPRSLDWWQLGRWVGDGWTGSGEVTVCCGYSEADQLRALLPGWRERSRATTVNFVLGDAELERWLNEHFGKGAANKTIPTWLLALPVCDQRAFLDGYVSADGHRTERGRALQVHCSTVSKSLALGIRLVAANVGFVPTMRHHVPPAVGAIEGRTVRQRPQWTVTWYEGTTKRSKSRTLDGRLWGRVGPVRPGRRCDVFNITVADDHTYVADGIVVYNCTHHSPANAKKVYARGYHQAVLEDDDWDEQSYANSERSRVTMSCVLRYVDHNHPEIVVVENVVEVTKWGPNRDGSTFRWWLGEIRKLGYDVQCCFFNSMFFPPCPQSRDRIYIVCWRAGNRRPDLDYRPTAFCTSDRCGGRLVNAVQTWKRPTKAWVGMDAWGKYLAQYDYRCPRCSEVVHPASWMALSAIDWTNLGPTLGERDRPVAPSTMERIRRALRKYWWAPPVLLPDTGAEVAGLSGAVAKVTHSASLSTAKSHSPNRYAANRSRHIGEQLSTLAQRGTEGLVSFLPIRSGRPRADAATDQLATLVADGGRLGLALLVKNNGAIDEAHYRGHHAGLPLGSVVASGRPQSVMVVPNRTHNDARHAADGTAPVMTSATQGVVVAAAGHTFEREGYTRARHHAEALFTQSTSAEFGVAALPVLRGDHCQERSVGEEITTVSAAGFHHGLVTAAFAKINGRPGDTAWHTVAEPLNTVTGRDTHGLVLLPWVDQWRSEPALITDQLAAVTTHLRHSLASIEPYEGEITDDVLMSVRFRMLEPDPELRRAMAFGDDYILLGNKTQMTSGLGNAVTPPVAAWIVERCLATLGDGATDKAA